VVKAGLIAHWFCITIHCVSSELSLEYSVSAIKMKGAPHSETILQAWACGRYIETIVEDNDIDDDLFEDSTEDNADSGSDSE
jgi:hypothetical protein